MHTRITFTNNKFMNCVKRTTSSALQLFKYVFVPTTLIPSEELAVTLFVGLLPRDREVVEVVGVKVVIGRSSLKLNVLFICYIYIYIICLLEISKKSQKVIINDC